MTNRYPGTCTLCGATVAPETGRLRKSGRRWTVAHFDCESPEAGAKRAAARGAARTVSTVVRTSGGTFYRNRNGRCEDAPCCGCCTF